MSRQIWIKEMGCGYRWNDEFKVLEWCPMYGDNWHVDDEEWGAVEEDLVGDEIVMYQGKDVTLSEVYRDVEKLLGVK